jgi:hypothetical protein
VKDTNRKEPAALVAKGCGKQLGKSRGWTMRTVLEHIQDWREDRSCSSCFIRRPKPELRSAEPLHVPHPIRETDDRAAWCNARERRVIISDLDGTLFFGVDLT